MPAIRPLSPAAIKKLLEAKGYSMIASDEFNMAFALGPDDEPIFVPTSVDLVPIEVAFSVAKKVGFNDYFGAIEESEPFPPDAPPAPPVIRAS